MVNNRSVNDLNNEDYTNISDVTSTKRGGRLYT